jgi:glyoxylase-like metal-dependent hydrolase (beta-lactamase superfamily II)
MPLPLEDSFADIVGKARRGLHKPSAPLPQEENAIRALAADIGMNPDALLESARGSWQPDTVPAIPGLHIFTTPFGDLQVNSYALADPATGAAAAIDTGSDCSDLLALGLRIEKIFITHTHGDHIFDLDRLVEKTGAEALAGFREPLEGASLVQDHAVLQIGSLRMEAIPTPGHAPGGITWFATGLAHPVAFTGDALFAGSMGGADSHWQAALDSLRLKILALPDDTILCPGHGPLTTVAWEKKHNPFA